MRTNDPEADYLDYSERQDRVEAAIRNAKSSGRTIVSLVESVLEHLEALEEEISADIYGDDGEKVDVFPDERESLQSALDGLTYWYESKTKKELATNGN